MVVTSTSYGGDNGDGDDEECNGGEPMYSKSQRIWGYETNDGSFAQFTTVQSRQLLKKPKHLSWEESGSYPLPLATAFRMLFVPMTFVCISCLFIRGITDILLAM